ncbi:hypothetical protein AX17_006319 [Amanita inopinata Kibby_2008]|nr:hypothetical protein AX17_006319 [Amanita inopinata Kibby_2008]
MIRCIDAAADFEDSRGSLGGGRGRRTWVAVKATALLPDAHALINLSKHIVRTRPSHRAQAVPFPGSPLSSDLAVLDASRSTESLDLTQEDIKVVRELHADLERICAHAQRRGVKVIMDAEYSWYQPALDALTLALMRKFNSLDNGNGYEQPLVYGTWQAYLRRTQGYLSDALQDARKHNYSLGVKLVRGAYHTYEVSAHTASASKSTESTLVVARWHGKHNTSMSISPDPEPPVWKTKAETDECYNGSVRMLINAIAADIKANKGESSSNHDNYNKSWQPLLASEVGEGEGRQTRAPRIGVLFGTHNWESCDVVLDELVKANLASKQEVEGADKSVVAVGEETLERVAIGQLYGMCDDLTDSLVERTRTDTPLVIKYVPYGALSEVLPYLGRRAIENKSVLGEGAAAKERKRAWEGIRARLFG